MRLAREESGRSAACGRRAAAFAIACVALAALTVAAFLNGASSVSLGDFAAWIGGAEVNDAAKSILVNVRLPRVLAALLAGAALAVAGAVIQSVLDNPLASPNVIGVNSGAGLLVLVAAALFPHALWAAPFAAFVGALTTAAVIFGISLHAGASRLTVVLSGIAITTVFGAGMNTVMIVAPDAYVGSSAFLAGGLSGVLLSDLAWPVVLIAAGLVTAMCGAHRLNVVALGDDMAHALGLNVRAVRLAMLAVASRCWRRGRARPP